MEKSFGKEKFLIFFYDFLIFLRFLLKNPKFHKPPPETLTFYKIFDFKSFQILGIAWLVSKSTSKFFLFFRTKKYKTLRVIFYAL